MFALDPPLGHFWLTKLLSLMTETQSQFPLNSDTGPVTVLIEATLLFLVTVGHITTVGHVTWRRHCCRRSEYLKKTLGSRAMWSNLFSDSVFWGHDAESLDPGSLSGKRGSTWCHRLQSLWRLSQHRGRQAGKTTILYRIRFIVHFQDSSKNAWFLHWTCLSWLIHVISWVREKNNSTSNQAGIWHRDQNLSMWGPQCSILGRQLHHASEEEKTSIDTSSKIWNHWWCPFSQVGSYSSQSTLLSYTINIIIGSSQLDVSRPLTGNRINSKSISKKQTRSWTTIIHYHCIEASSFLTWSWHMRNNTTASMTDWLVVARLDNVTRFFTLPKALAASNLKCQTSPSYFAMWDMAARLILD